MTTYTSHDADLSIIRGKRVAIIMKRVLADVQSGKFATEWMDENARGGTDFHEDASACGISSHRGSGREIACYDAVAFEE